MRGKSIPPSNFNRVGSLLLCCALLLPSTISAGGGESGRFLWKSVPQAQIKLNDKTPLAWNVFQTDKKKESNLVVILLGRRYVAFNIKTRTAYAVALTDLQARGGVLESGNLFSQAKVLPTSDWSLRDVGPAELIKLKLSDYGTTLQLELPHAPDLRGLY